jgi:hypothetical protein
VPPERKAFKETASGAKADHAELHRIVLHLANGDMLMVRITMRVSLNDIQEAFEFAPQAAATSIRPFCASSRASSTIVPNSTTTWTYCRMTIGDSEKFLPIPDKREVSLGKPLALDFARQFLPADFDNVRQFFNRRGAYARLKELLDRRGALDYWYDFEAKAEERQGDSIGS